MHFKAWRRLANSIGIDFDEKRNEELKGVGRTESLIKILSWGGIEKTKEERIQLAHQKNQWYKIYLDDLGPDNMLPGVLDFIDELIAANVKIGLGSASKNAQPILEKIGIIDRFDNIIDGTKTTKGKPDPQVFVMGAEGLDVEPQHCVVFEDAQAGIQAANRGGFYSVGVGDPETLADADANILNFNNFNFKLLKTLLNI
ncbi:UNVERIFIED_CONTAM: hypothetical protein GTU68_052024 [Idotea baltica]|nr:hypothetical protein [Idotea baltica]